jgi:hypothetical protein
VLLFGRARSMLWDRLARTGCTICPGIQCVAAVLTCDGTQCYLVFPLSRFCLVCLSVSLSFSLLSLVLAVSVVPLCPDLCRLASVSHGSWSSVRSN